MPPRNSVTAQRTVSTVLPPDLHALYESYRDRHGLTNSDALRSIIAKGLGQRPAKAKIERGRPTKPPENKGETKTSRKS